MKRCSSPTIRSWRSSAKRSRPEGADLCLTHGITEQTYYRRTAKYGGMELSEMQRLKQIEDENRRLKQLVAQQTLDIQALKAVVAKKVVGPMAGRERSGWLQTRDTTCDGPVA